MMTSDYDPEEHGHGSELNQNQPRIIRWGSVVIWSSEFIENYNMVYGMRDPTNCDNTKGERHGLFLGVKQRLSAMDLPRGTPREVVVVEQRKAHVAICAPADGGELVWVPPQSLTLYVDAPAEYRYVREACWRHHG